MKTIIIDGVEYNLTPKAQFKKGDWVVWDNKICCHIDNIYQGKETLMYTITDTNNMTRSYSVKGFDNNVRLWTIQDAKDGDVLVDKDNNIGIYKEIEGICWHSYIYLGCDNCIYGFSIGGSHTQNNTKPATKEQREQLEKAMADAGFTFDFDKKELKEIKQNPAWSEEDEKVLEDIEEAIINYWHGDTQDILLDWLKSLKERVQPQPKQEWSEDEEDAIGQAIVALEDMFDEDHPRNGYTGYKLPFIDAAERLKSLKRRYTWRPSEDQMEALVRCVDSLEVKEVEEEPVSEDLEEEIIRYIGYPKEVDEDVSTTKVRQAAHHFAKWQKEQFEQNRLAHCDALTKEQAQMESDFVTKHLKENNRTPTFIDAIEYGMKLQKEQMIKDGIDVKVKVDAGGYPYIDKTIELYDYDEDVPLAKAGEKVKVIIMKEE